MRANGALVGVLALQGASEPHREVFARLGIESRAVRSRAELEGLTHLVLPGGESTTLAHLLTLFDMTEALLRLHASGTLALFGTCAGAILLARTRGSRPPTLGLLDATLERNAYGSQVDSFAREVELELGSGPARRLCAVFIRAPRFVALGPGVRILARLDADPIAVEAPGLLATSFHPELSRSSVLHERFLATALPGRSG